MKIFALATLFLCAALQGAHAQSAVRPAAIAQPETMTTGMGNNTNYSPLAVAHTEAMARVLGDSVSGNGTRYFTVTDHDLAKAKTPAEVLKLLSPSIIKGDQVRRVEVVVDLQHEVTLHVPQGTEVRLGTVLLSQSPQAVDVESIINAADLTVVGK